MLDFFLIADEQPNNSPLTQTEYMGGIRLQKFEQAQRIQLLECLLDFYADFRLSSVQVKQKLILLQNARNKKVNALHTILQKAVNYE